MKENKSDIIFFIMSVIMQMYLFKISKSGESYAFVFGVSNQLYSSPAFCLFELYAVIPVVFIILFFSSGTAELINGYGKLLIIRGVSKTRIYLKKIVFVFLKITLAAFFQLIAYGLMSDKGECNSLIRAIIVYCFGILFLIQMQSFLEFFVEPNVSAMITIIYLYISYFIVCMSEKEIFRRFFILGFIFGENNGSAYDMELYTQIFIIYIISNVILLFFNIMKFQKSDIY
ncbi:MAG: DUF2705 family protein [Oscillospiraceae bacterium]|nr:DUF2705 family protein [Oscillospiraceae bacterium]